MQLDIIKNFSKTNVTKKRSFKSYHVGMSFSRHFFTAVQVQKLIHLRCRQTISDFKILHDEHLSGDWALWEAGIAFRLARGIDFVLKLHLHRHGGGTIFILFKSDFLFKIQNTTHHFFWILSFPFQFWRKVTSLHLFASLLVDLHYILPVWLIFLIWPW